MPEADMSTTPKVLTSASVGLWRAKLLMKCEREPATHAGRFWNTFVTGLSRPSQ
jgi:hypothetical protein